jgi:AcrR family transcriptional regulator
VADQSIDGRMPLRNEPVQARSTARLATLLDAAAGVVNDIGYELLTTAMVAERANASIGTVYRYFPDRIALLQALGSRNLERVIGRVMDEIFDEMHEDITATVMAAFDVFVDACRTEPGFRSLRLGDVIDLRPPAKERTYNSIVADRMLDGLISRFGIEDSPALRFQFEIAIEVSDALAARAFSRDGKGDEAFLGARRDLLNTMLADTLSS